MELKDIFISEVSEKLKSRDKYRRLALELDAGGYPKEARILSGMADDEDRHANLLMTLSESLLPALEREELKLGERMIEVPLGRPVPETYGDWVTLGMDIKETAGIDDYKTTAEVNTHLEHIYKEEETDPGTVRESKMWLVRKAGELGIT